MIDVTHRTKPRGGIHAGPRAEGSGEPVEIAHTTRDQRLAVDRTASILDSGPAIDAAQLVQLQGGQSR